MSIKKGSRDVTYIAKGNRAVSAVYRGITLVWMAVRSCFGSGVWVDEKPWIDSENWKNEK